MIAVLVLVLDLDSWTSTVGLGQLNLDNWTWTVGPQLVTQLDDLCIYHWFFVSYQQRDGVQQCTSWTPADSCASVRVQVSFGV